MRKYDDASWHHGGDFPSELSYEHACVHIGMFMGWLVDRELQGALLVQEFKDVLDRFRRRELTPVELLHACCDDKLISGDLSDEGNAFATAYYDSMYIDDYDELLAEELPTLYHVENSWSNYDRLKKRIDQRYAHWKAEQQQGRS